VRERKGIFVMDLKLRTILIGLISLTAVLAIYMLYSHVSKTPQIDIDTVGQLTNTEAESDVGDFDDEIGKIGDVGIAALTNPCSSILRMGKLTGNSALRNFCTR